MTSEIYDDYASSLEILWITFRNAINNCLRKKKLGIILKKLIKMRVLALALTFTTLASIQACTLDGLTVNGCYYSAIVNESGCSTTQLETLLGNDYKERIEGACHEAIAIADEEMLPWEHEIAWIVSLTQ